MPISVACPQCGQSLRAPDTAAGKRLKCPRCQAAVSVPAAGPTVEAIAAESTAAVDPSAPAPAAEAASAPAGGAGSPFGFAVDPARSGGGGKSAGLAKSPRGQRRSGLGPLHYFSMGGLALVLIVILGFKFLYKDTSSQAMFDRAVKRYVDQDFRPEVRDLIKKHHDACYKEAQAGGFSEKEYFSLLDARVTKEPVFVKLKR